MAQVQEQSSLERQVAGEDALHLKQTKQQFNKDRGDLDLRTLLGIKSRLSDIWLGNDSSVHGLSLVPGVEST